MATGAKAAIVTGAASGLGRAMALGHTADLTQPWAFDGTVAAARERFGRIDILINNAGIGQASVRGISERVRSDSGKRPLNSGAASSL